MRTREKDIVSTLFRGFTVNTMSKDIEGNFFLSPARARHKLHFLSAEPRNAIFDERARDLLGRDNGGRSGFSVKIKEQKWGEGKGRGGGEKKERKQGRKVEKSELTRAGGEGEGGRGGKSGRSLV